MLPSLRAGRRASQLLAPYVRRLNPVGAGRSRCYASVTDLSTLPKPGDKLYGFTVQRTKHVPELELSAVHFQHDNTGADYLHVARNDTNNVFSIGFKTNPPDATGVPHILEHVTLCGSEKYPVRDPFFKMLPRSLQNFMNAFTSSDYTMYPFATTNAQDFKNLMGIYLDATLRPLLKRSDFVQEGWRIGPENPLASAEEQSAKDLVFKGVVYNEMKGQMSDATYLFYVRFFEHIVPALNNSGGDPQKMTELTYEQLKEYHRAHYHPSNSKILTYGDQPVQDHLKMLGEQLEDFRRTDIDRDLKRPISLSNGAQHVTVQGPVDPLTPPDAQFKTSTTWLMGDTTNIPESFALQIATSLLLDGYGSPLYRTLIESGLGSDFTPNTGYDTSGVRGIFSVGLNGVKEENVSKIQGVVSSTIKQAIAGGFDKRKVDGLMHQLELGLKHKTAQFGMNLIQRLKPGWFNGIDPFDALAWNKIVDQFKAEYAKGGYLEGLVEKYLLTDNTLTFTMVPNTQYGAELALEEQRRLRSKIAEVVSTFPSEAEAHKALRERELELVKEQDSGQNESLDSLPTLRVKDIPRQGKKYDVKDAELDGKTKIQWRETATNGLTYFRALAVFKDLPDQLRMLLPLFFDSLMRIGTKDKTMEELEDLIKLKTGGVGFSYHSIASPSDPSKVEEGLQLSGYALDGNIPAMYELLQTLLLETDFDSPKAHTMIRQLLQAGAAGASDSIASTGHAFARRWAEAGLRSRGRYVEQTAGLTQVKLITALASTAEEGSEVMTQLVQQMKALQNIAVANMQQSIRVALTCGSDAVDSNQAALQRFLSSMPKSQDHQAAVSAISETSNYPTPSKTFFAFPYQVSYSGLAIPTVPYTDPSGAAFSILSGLLTHKHLHHEIREKGGAYGGGASHRALDGLFGMYSYRDPNPTNTFGIMQNATRWAAEQNWTDRQIEEAKLTAFQGLDAPISVNSEGMTRFVSGIDEAMQQRRREELLDVDAKQLRDAAERLTDGLEKANFVLLGPDTGLVKDEEGWRRESLGLIAQEEEELRT